MSGHDYLHDLAIYSSVVGDGGPRGYRRRGSPLPEKYLPGRWWMKQDEATKQRVLKALAGPPPAPWALKLICNEKDYY